MRIGIDCRKIADFGIGTHLRGLLQGLAAVADRDDVFLLLGPRTIVAGIPDDPRFIHVEANAPHYSLRELVRIGRVANGLKLDLFHAPHYVLPMVRGPVTVTIHDLIHLKVRHASPLAPFYARAMLSRAVARSARILTVSEAVRADLERTFPESRGRVVVVPNGVDPSFFEPAAAALPTGIARGEYFLFVGNDKPHKNLDGLAEAFALVRARRPELRLVVAGSSPSRLREEGVLALGKVSDQDLHALYQGALALVQPSRHEGFGLPVVEAMASGAPVIVSDEPALREVGGEAVVVADAFDPERLAAAMIALAAEEGTRRRCSEAGRRRAALFTWERAAQSTLAVWRRIAG